jgi:hypothetical protein
MEQMQQKKEQVANCNTPGPTTNFGYESIRGSIKPMGIRNDQDAQIIQDALKLDCSKIAQNAFLLYRGSDFQKDSPYSWGNHDKPYSLSFGTSLFAGCLYDGGATAFHHMRDSVFHYRENQNGYVVAIPFSQLNTSPFYIPPTNTVAQLSGYGETFHARTKAWQGYDVENIGGINLGANLHVRDHLKSDLSKDTLIAQFEQYKKEAIHLK